MNSAPSPRPKFRSAAIIGWGTLMLVGLLFLVLLLDSILRRTLWFNATELIIHVPFACLATGIGGYSLYKAIKLPPDTRPLSLGRRIVLFCLFSLFTAVPVFGIWTVIDEIATCRQIKAEGKAAIAKVENAELEYAYSARGVRSNTVHTPGEANEVEVKLKFAAGDTIVNDWATLSYLVNTDAIAKVWREVQTGSVKVQYRPGNPKEFRVVSAPCRESLFAVFLGR